MRILGLLLFFFAGCLAPATQYVTLSGDASYFTSRTQAERIYLDEIKKVEEKIGRMIVPVPVKVEADREGFGISGSAVPFLGISDSGGALIRHDITIDGHGSNWLNVLRHEFRHAIWNQLTEAEKSEAFAHG